MSRHRGTARRWRRIQGIKAGEVSTGAGVSHGDALESGRACEFPDEVRRLEVRDRKEPFGGGRDAQPLYGSAMLEIVSSTVPKQAVIGGDGMCR